MINGARMGRIRTFVKKWKLRLLLAMLKVLVRLTPGTA